MARLCGVNLPKGKRIEIALTYIYGMGRAKSKEMLLALNIHLDTKVEDLTENDLAKLRDALAKEQTEGDLRRQVQLNIKRLQDIGTLRGFRHRKGLPTRGQRTRTNARTRKGRKKTVANKKKVSK